MYVIKLIKYMQKCTNGSVFSVFCSALVVAGFLILSFQGYFHGTGATWGLIQYKDAVQPV